MSWSSCDIKACSIRADTQEQATNGSISLPCPFREHKALRAPPSDNRSKESKGQERKRGGECIDEQALYSSDSGNLRIGEQDPRTESCRLEVSISFHNVR